MNRLEQYTILRSIILLLLQWDPLNLLPKLLEFTNDSLPVLRTRMIDFVEEGDLFTSLIEVSEEYQEDCDMSERFYECVSFLTLNELLIDLYFAINHMHRDIDIQFSFGEQEIVVHIDSLGIYETSELKSLKQFLTHFNKFSSVTNNFKHKPSIIKVRYNNDFHEKHSTIDNDFN